jgi:hypothetical protein
VGPQFHVLTEIGEQWFTQYPKAGDRLDTGEPKFRVTKLEKIGEPVTFRTTVGGYYGWMKYDIQEVRVIAPKGANAYYLAGDIQIISTGGNPEFHEVPIQFCKADVDYSQRILQDKELSSDLPRILRIAEALQSS